MVTGVGNCRCNSTEVTLYLTVSSPSKYRTMITSSIIISFIALSVSSLRFPITMPFIRPGLPSGESYLCTGVGVDPNTDLYITGFTPVASSSTVHHLMVIGCEAPVTGVETNLWNCGGTLSEPGLESPGTTCPGSSASQEQDNGNQRLETRM